MTKQPQSWTLCILVQKGDKLMQQAVKPCICFKGCNIKMCK